MQYVCGADIAWLALSTTDTQAVATALALQETREATWAEGIDAAYGASVFVTPPVGEWTLVASTALFPPDRADLFVRPLLERLGRQFAEVQYFCQLSAARLQVWARAKKGRLVRGFGWLGQRNLTLWNEGAPTKEEQYLGLRHHEEDCVMRLAMLWSIDPTTLDEQYQEPVMGLVGRLAGHEKK